jgi:UDP-N-acetyl-D-glucosamine dehydrogenase
MMKVCVQGLGFVGSAMATAVASSVDENGKHNYDVVGIDLATDEGRRRIEAINRGHFPFETNDQELVDAISRVFAIGNLRASLDPEEYSTADIVIVDVNLDIPYLDEKPNLEMESFKNAIRILGKRIARNTLVLVETTVPPGTCHFVVEPILREEFKKRGLCPDDIRVAHSYERVMPGRDYLHSITDFWRVFAADNNEAADSCKKFLESIVNTEKYPLTQLKNTVSSETAKVLENAYRATNIAFIAEWSSYAEAIGIDLYDIINAIAVRPTHSNIRYPGLGVGGYCLTKDPAFAPAAARTFFKKELEFPLSMEAIRINSAMPNNTITRIDGFYQDGFVGKKVIVCGFSYRPDVGDTRYSPSIALCKEIKKRGAKVYVFDSYVKDQEIWGLGFDTISTMGGFGEVDIVILAVAHSDIKSINFIDVVKRGTLIYDTANVLTLEQRSALRSKGISVESCGRGSGL